MEITDKRVVVTGAASGIGKALVHAFNKTGAGSLVAVDINAEEVGKVAEEIDGRAITANVAREADIQRVIEAANDYAGGIDIFCHTFLQPNMLFLKCSNKEVVTWLIQPQLQAC